MRRILVLAPMLLLTMSCAAIGSDTSRIDVPGDHSTLAAAIAEAPIGATIVVGPGTYREQLTIVRPVSIIGEAGSVLVAGPAEGPIISILDTSHVTISGLSLLGGDVGVSVRGSDEVVITNNVILDSRRRGVHVVYGAAEVTSNEVRPAPGPYAIGIHVANAESWPRSVISGNLVEEAGAYGIAVNFAVVDVVDNVVRGGDSAGLAINEMSIAEVRDNLVEDAPRYGILVTDMSDAVVVDNTVSGAVEPIKVQYHSAVELAHNTTD